jgi:hypothetical protein
VVDEEGVEVEIVVVRFACRGLGAWTAVEPGDGLAATVEEPAS